MPQTHAKTPCSESEMTQPNSSPLSEIEERRQVEDALRASELRYRTLTFATNAVVWQTDAEGSITQTLDSWSDFTGQTETEYRGWGWIDAIHPEDRQRVAQIWQKSLDNGDVYECEYRLRYRDGSYRHTLARGAPLRNAQGQIVEWIGANTDIENLRLTAEVLQQSELRSRFLDELGEVTRGLSEPEIILAAILERLGQHLRVSRCAYADVKKDQNHFTIHHNWTAGQPKLLGDFLLDQFGIRAAADMRAGRTLVIDSVEYELVGQGRETFRAAGIQAIVCCPLVKFGRLVAMMAVHQEQARPWTDSEIRLVEEVAERCWASIERARVAREHRAGQEKFRALADNIAQLAWMADAEGWIFWYNQRWFEYTGTTLEEMQGWGWKAVHHPDHVERVVAKFADHVQRGAVWEDTFPLRSKDGTWGWFLSRAFPMRDDNGSIVLWCGTNTDVTEQRQAADELRAHQTEIEALNARLRRAMQETHHRIKNNLQVIAGLVEVETKETTPTGELPPLKRINQHVLALAAIHDLLTQQAKRDPALDTLSVQVMLERLTEMLQSTLPHRTIHAAIADVPLSVQKCASLAMLVNEAVANAVKHGHGDILLQFTIGDTTAHLEICDDGAGFPSDFNPKTAAHTGLELIDSAARWDLRGSVQYRNNGDGGACVVVEFPLEERD